MLELKSQVLVVTGGSRGIGAATVRLAAQAGARVCFSYRRDREAAETVCAAAGAQVVAFQGDAADEAFARKLFDAAERAHGPVTMLVNNAGITGRYGAFADLPVDTMRRTLDVNVLGPMMLAQEAIRRWKNGGIPGRMVNISSIAATLGAPHEYVHYAASKAAIDALTIGLGKEVAAQGIRVNAVAPGTAFTDIHAEAGVPDRPVQVAGRIPLQRAAQPEEIAQAVLWLLSDAASYVTATVLRVSGGI
jgi:NAD(P)-dependent dehydrogenase (short-subunit alcohol dehydrogenase family)